MLVKNQNKYWIFLKRQCCAVEACGDRAAAWRRCRRLGREQLQSKRQTWAADRGRPLSKAKWETRNGPAGLDLAMMIDENTSKTRTDSVHEGWRPEFGADWCRVGSRTDKSSVDLNAVNEDPDDIADVAGRPSTRVGIASWMDYYTNCLPLTLTRLDHEIG